MSYALNARIHIHYETVGQGPPLIMSNSLGVSSTFLWGDSGWAAALQDEFQLVMMEERGKGRSSKPYDTAQYGHEHDTRDIIAVMDDLGLPSAHYLGWGSGAWRGWFALQDAPNRFRSFVLIGQGPYAPGLGPTDPQPLLKITQEHGLDGLCDLGRRVMGERWTPERERELLSEDIEALIARFGVVERTEPERYLPRLQVPLLSICSPDSDMHDGMRKATALAPRGRFISVPGLDYIDTAFAIETLAPQIIGFLREAEAGLTRETA